jgi:hypothetical protein
MTCLEEETLFVDEPSNSKRNKNGKILKRMTVDSKQRVLEIAFYERKEKIRLTAAYVKRILTKV